MPAPISNFVKLKECVYSYSEASKKSEAEFLRLWRICFRGFKQMGINAFWQPKTEVLQVSPQKVAFWPEDCITWIKIGQFNWSGELQTIRVNNNMTVYHADMDERWTDIAPEIQDCWGSLVGDTWFNGGDYWYGDGFTSASNTPFGLHSRLIQFGECVVDERKRLIALNMNYQYAEVVMEYLSAPDKDKEYAIPIQFEEAMIAWLGWQDIIYLPSTGHVNNNEVRMRAINFKNQCKLAKKMYKPWRLQEAAQVAVESQMLAPKP